MHGTKARHLLKTRAGPAHTLAWKTTKHAALLLHGGMRCWRILPCEILVPRGGRIRWLRRMVSLQERRLGRRKVQSLEIGSPVWRLYGLRKLRS